jgi:hypothetical protein
VDLHVCFTATWQARRRVIAQLSREKWPSTGRRCRRRRCTWRGTAAVPPPPQADDRKMPEFASVVQQLAAGFSTVSAREDRR